MENVVQNLISKDRQLNSKIEKHSLMDENIRVNLVNYFSESNWLTKDAYLAFEVQYGERFRRADIVVFSDYCHAIEIKSDCDDLSKLVDQIEDYRATFDRVSVAVTRKHLTAARELLSTRVGIILVGQGCVKVLRFATVTRRLDKWNLVSTCSGNTLRKILGTTTRQNSILAMRQQAQKKCTIAELRLAMLTEFKSRYIERYRTFSTEACYPFRSEDLSYLKQQRTLQINSILTSF